MPKWNIDKHLLGKDPAFIKILESDLNEESEPIDVLDWIVCFFSPDFFEGIEKEKLEHIEKTTREIIINNIIQIGKQNLDCFVGEYSKYSLLNNEEFCINYDGFCEWLFNYDCVRDNTRFFTYVDLTQDEINYIDNELDRYFDSKQADWSEKGYIAFHYQINYTWDYDPEKFITNVPENEIENLKKELNYYDGYSHAYNCIFSDENGHFNNDKVQDIWKQANSNNPDIKYSNVPIVEFGDDDEE